MKMLWDEIKLLFYTVIDSPFGKPIMYAFFAMMFLALVLSFELEQTNNSKVDSPREQVSNYEINRIQTLTGTLELLWDTPYYTTTSPIRLLSDNEITVSLTIDVKLIDNDSMEYLYDIPFTQTISATTTLDINADGFIDKKDLEILKENYESELIDLNEDGIVDIFDVVMIAYSLDTPGTGLFNTINYTITVPDTINQQTEEWVKVSWVVTSTGVIYLETGEVFTNNVTIPIGYCLDWSNHLTIPDSEDYCYNRTVDLGWAYTYWLPIIMKGK